MKTFICTTGTSIAVNAKVNIDRLKEKPIKITEEFDSDTKVYKNAILKKIEGISKEDLKSMSAEMKSLVKIGIDRTDKVVLISSDTTDGFLCAETLKDIIKKYFECDVVLYKIEGLQAYNGDLFSQKGLKNLFNVLFDLLDRHQYEEIILNPTGGYKSVVPYLTIFGMLFNKPVKYIHEESEDLITLSGIPLVYDEALMFRIEDKLKRIYKEGSITREEWNLGIDYNDQRYESLIEIDGGLVTLSGIGQLLYEKFRKNNPENIERDLTPPENKENRLLSLGVPHHGIYRIINISKRLLQSPYVVKVVNSCENNPSSKNPITPLLSIETKKHLQHEETGICIVTDTKSDEGFSFLIKTTAKNDYENEVIANLLRRNYFL